jgi:hypothetical protein
VPRRLLPTNVAVLVGALAVSVVAGCGGNGVHAQTGPTTGISPTVSTAPSTTPPVPTSRQTAAAAALVKVVAYEHTLDELAVDGHMSLDRLYRVSTQPDVTDEIAFLNRFRSRGDRQRGASRVTGTRVDAVDLPGAGGGTATARVSICLDVAQVRAVDRAGKSIVAKARKPFYLTHLVLVEHKYPEPSGWLVKHVSAREERSCSV